MSEIFAGFHCIELRSSIIKVQLPAFNRGFINVVRYLTSNVFEHAVCLWEPE